MDPLMLVFTLVAILHGMKTSDTIIASRLETLQVTE